MAVEVKVKSGRLEAGQAMQEEYNAALDALVNGWTAMTAAQRADALRTGLVIVMKAVRYLMRRAR